MNFNLNYSQQYKKFNILNFNIIYNINININIFLVLFRLNLEIEIQRYIDIYVDFRARLCVYCTHIFHCIYVDPARDLSLILCMVILIVNGNTSRVARYESARAALVGASAPLWHRRPTASTRHPSLHPPLP